MESRTPRVGSATADTSWLGDLLLLSAVGDSA